MISRIKLAGAGPKAGAAPALLSFAAALFAAAVLLGACNTAEGIGDDLEDAGEEVGDALD